MTETENAVLREMIDDYLGLWSLVQTVRDIEGEKPEAEIRGKCLDVIRSLAGKNLIEIGQARVGGGFDAWESGGEAGVERISEEWKKLGRDPDIGEIAWLNLTPTGEAMAKGLESADMEEKGYYHPYTVMPGCPRKPNPHAHHKGCGGCIRDVNDTKSTCEECGAEWHVTGRKTPDERWSIPRP